MSNENVDWTKKSESLGDQQALDEAAGLAPEPAPMPMPPTRAPAKGKGAAAGNGGGGGGAATPAERAGFVWRKPNYFRNILDSFIPTAERIKFWKRTSDGHMQHIGSYTPKDLDKSHDIEHFVQTYLVAKYGPGDYEVGIVNSAGQPTKQITVSIAEELPVAHNAPPPAAQGLGGAAELVDKLMRRIDHLESAPAAPPPSITDQLREIEALKKTLGVGDKPVDPSMMMMMLERMKPAAAGPSAEVLALREELAILRGELMARAQPVGPAFATDPGAMSMEGINSILDRALQAAKPEMGLKDMIALFQMMQPPKPPEPFGIKDIMGMVPMLLSLLDKYNAPMKAAVEQLAEAISEIGEEKEKKGGLKGMLEDIKVVREIVSLGQPAGGNDGFGSFLAQAFQNFPEKLDAIGNLVERISKAEAAPDDGSKPAAHANEPAPAAAAPAPAKKPKAKLLPDNFKEFVEPIGEATTDVERIQATLIALTELGKIPKWKPWLQKAVQLAKAGDKDNLLKMLKAVIEGIAANKEFEAVLPLEAREATIAAFTQHIEEVARTVAELA